ncbi:DNA-directed RNA polymerase III subunit C34 [Rhizoctonia solani AG-1 IB]|uniref:DNA-directed RNA polymerase III subunit C34 n=1 Tax=Thanatephorus cucumeris (strain AG1-IB / isolate 7/3/14) TaxID=1108050 RepID=M5C3V8_THACB|nr:DNA-directed RNA polymerase III subunit C34 [Rhizoctonia solani AG-1 IB]
MSTLTPGELEVYQACSQAEDGMLRQKELEKATTIKGPEMAAAVNGLLKKSLLKIMKDSKGVLSYKAVDKADAKVVGLMDTEESIVYKKIQESKNEGIWTKHLKSTELHQSIITRALKSLEKKGLVKSIKSVKVTSNSQNLHSRQPSAIS